MRFVHFDYLNSTACKLPGPAAKNCAQLGGLPREDEPEFRTPMTSGSSVPLESTITDFTAWTTQNFASVAGSKGMENCSVPKEGQVSQWKQI